MALSVISCTLVDIYTGKCLVKTLVNILVNDESHYFYQTARVCVCICVCILILK